ncbi:MAG: hypothetical protein G01um101470_212 [Parcubacteria group bacterium Gr01-1014_70]|nr:MAG: hypothetical protein G01um101470_212 [Parcubacteria group bacterium Gr01-1014_70]
MKTKLWVLCTFLSVVSASAQQKYLLPIGSNVNNRPAKVVMVVGPVDAWEKRAEDIFSYQPSMGEFEKMIKTRFQALVNKLHTAGLEKSSYEMTITTDSGPFVVKSFFLEQSDGQWVAPTEVLDVQLKYGVAVSWKLQGVTSVRLRLYKNSELVKLWDTQDRNSGDSPCDIGSANSALAMGWASVSSEYGLPELKADWWDSGDVTLNSFDGFATFSVLDGAFLESSTPPPAFLESLRAPEMQSAQSQTPVLVMSSPKIARITRNGNTTEITVSAESSISANIEFSETLNGTWYSIPKYLQPLSLQTGSNKFTHTTEAPSCFYRVRLADSSSPR